MVVLRESLAGENAIAKMIPNGLARETRNRKRVGVYGEPARYQWDVYDSIHNERAIFRQHGWYRRSWKLLSLFLGMKAFFICLFKMKENDEYDKRQVWHSRGTVYS